MAFAQVEMEQKPDENPVSIDLVRESFVDNRLCVETVSKHIDQGEAGVVRDHAGAVDVKEDCVDILAFHRREELVFDVERLHVKTELQLLACKSQRPAIDRKGMDPGWLPVVDAAVSQVAEHVGELVSVGARNVKRAPFDAKDIVRRDSLLQQPLESAHLPINLSVPPRELKSHRFSLHASVTRRSFSG